MSEDAFDIIIVGAGIVGAALSTALGRAGRRVLVCERDMSEPDRIVGELLQPGGVRALQLLGLADALEGIDAIPTKGYSVFMGAETSVNIAYPTPGELDTKYARGEPIGTSGHYEGRSFHHGRFVSSLRRLAQAEPNVTIRESNVSELVHAPDGRVLGVRTSQGAEFRAPVTIVADGIFSRFRRHYPGAYAPCIRSHFVGVELPPDSILVPNHGHVLLNDGKPKPGTDGRALGPVLVYQIGQDATRILVDVPGQTLPSGANGDLARYLEQRVAPQLPPRVRDALVSAVRGGARLRTMANNFLPPSMQGQGSNRRGLVLVGDAMNIRHPLTGGGMTVAFWDCVYLTHILGTGKWSPLPRELAFNVAPGARDLRNWSALQGELRTWHWRRKSLAGVINVLAQSLYSLFGMEAEDYAALRMGCFRYFERGGECKRGPISLLSGLAPDPMLLVYHFFAVAVYTMVLMFRGQLDTPAGAKLGNREPLPLSAYPTTICRAAMVLCTACGVIFPVIWTELKPNASGGAKPYLGVAAALAAAGLAFAVYAASNRALASA